MSIKPSSAQCQGSCFQQENTYTAAELKKVKLFFFGSVQSLFTFHFKLFAKSDRGSLSFVNGQAM